MAADHITAHFVVMHTGRNIYDTIDIRCVHVRAADVGIGIRIIAGHENRKVTADLLPFFSKAIVC